MDFGVRVLLSLLEVLGGSKAAALVGFNQNYLRGDRVLGRARGLKKGRIPFQEVME